MQQQFSRTALIYGREAMDRLAGSRVIIFGIGGVGGYALEALVRSGIGHVDIVDSDTVSVTNLNRQILALTETSISEDIIHVRGALVRAPGGDWIRKDLNKTDLSRRDVPVMIPRVRELSLPITLNRKNAKRSP